MAEYTNEDLVKLAYERAKQHGKPMPRTAHDVESLTGFQYTDPNPRDIGKTFTVQVRQAK